MAFSLGVLGLIASPRSAPAELPKVAPAPTPTVQQQPNVSSLIATVAMITKVAHTRENTLDWVSVTIENFGTKETTVTLKEVDNKLSCNKVDGKVVCSGVGVSFKIPAGGKVVHKDLLSNANFCEHDYSLKYQLSGVGVDDRVRKATYTNPVFVVGATRLGGVGAPPSSDVEAKQVRITSASIENGYTCEKKLKVKATIKNGSGITPHHLSIHLLDQPMYGAPPSVGGSGPKIGEASVSVGGTGSVDVAFSSDNFVSGRGGTVTLKLVDSSDELGNKLGYYKWAEFDVKISASVWKLE